MIGSNFAPVSNGSATGDISIVNNATGYYASITSSGDIELDISSTPNGDYKTGVDTLSIDTNTKNGYKLYISTIDHSSDSPALPSGTPANGLINSATGSYISPSSGTVNAPVRLATNTWGYAASRSTNTGTKVTYTNTSAAPTEAAGGQAVWKAVPVYGNEDIFYTNTDPTNASSGSTTSGDSNDTNTIDVYYAASANTGLSSGIYTNTVVYTAIVDGGSDETGLTEASIFPVSQDGLSAGTEVTIATGLYPGFSVDDLGTITVTIGGQSCTNVTPVLSEIGSLNITCEAPAQTNYGSYTVMVTVAKYGKTYTLTNAYEYVDPTPPAFFTITKMQQMTHDICTDAKLPTPAANETTALTASTWASGSRTGIPTTTLLDDRAGQVSYTVKKLADGKCWMTENLALPPETTITAEDSDLDGTVVSSYTLPSSRTPFTDSTANDTEEMYDPVAGGGTTATSLGYKVGNYYSWRTATAGTGRGAGLNPGTGVLTDAFGTDMTVRNNNTLVSICPKGWRLPTSGNNSTAGTTGITTPGSATNLVNGDFAALYQAYGGTGTSGSDTTMYTQMTNPSYGPNFALSGFVDTGGQFDVSSSGYFWSSTVLSNGSAYYMVLNTSVVYSQDSYYKFYGQSVRCVSR